MSTRNDPTVPRTGHYYCIQYDQCLAYFLGKPGWFKADIMREERPVPCNTEAVELITGLLRENDQTLHADLPELFTGFPPTVSWTAWSPTAGELVVRCSRETLSRSLLLCGVDPGAERLALRRFNKEAPKRGGWMRDEPDDPPRILSVKERPLLMSIMLFDKNAPSLFWCANLAQRCFAAAYFRRRFVA